MTDRKTQLFLENEESELPWENQKSGKTACATVTNLPQLKHISDEFSSDINERYCFHTA